MEGNGEDNIIFAIIWKLKHLKSIYPVRNQTKETKLLVFINQKCPNSASSRSYSGYSIACVALV